MHLKPALERACTKGLPVTNNVCVCVCTCVCVCAYKGVKDSIEFLFKLFKWIFIEIANMVCHLVAEITAGR